MPIALRLPTTTVQPPSRPPRLTLSLHHVVVFTQRHEIRRVIRAALEIRNHMINLIRPLPTRQQRVLANVLATEIRTPQALATNRRPIRRQPTPPR